MFGTRHGGIGLRKEQELLVQSSGVGGRHARRVLLFDGHGHQRFGSFPQKVVSDGKRSVRRTCVGLRRWHWQDNGTPFVQTLQMRGSIGTGREVFEQSQTKIPKHQREKFLLFW